MKEITLSQKIWSTVCLIILAYVFGTVIWKDINTVSLDANPDAKKEGNIAKTDAETFGLKGPVKYVEDDFMLNARMTFNRKGRLTKIGDYKIDKDDVGNNGVVVRRDELGRITFVGKAEKGYHFEYGDKGLYKWWNDTDETYQTVTNYDDEGRPIAAGTTEDYNSTDFDVEIEYSYSEFDEYGNWRSCNVTNDMGTRIAETDWERPIKYYK